MMGAAPPKIAQLIAEARAELTRLGIETDGKRSDELLNMAREQRNNSARPQRQTKCDHKAGAERLAAAAPATEEKSAQ
jgi:hypothetical protein